MGSLGRHVTRRRKWKREIDSMTRRNVIFSLVSSGIACFLLTGVGQTRVGRGLVSTTGSDTNTQAITLAHPDSGAWRTGRPAKLGRLQHWINDHPVRTRIAKAAATLAVLLAFQLLVQTSQPFPNS